MDFAGMEPMTAAEGSRILSGGRDGLAFLWLELTQHCNLRCRHCYTVSSPARAHPAIDWRAVIDQAHGAGCRRVQFIGGEPLSHPDIMTYVDHAAGLGFDFIEIYSNLTGLTESLCEGFSRAGVCLATSFYSSRPHLHDRVTLTPGSFEETVAGIERALRWGLKLRAGIIMQEFDDEPPAAKIAFLERLGISRERIKVDHVRPVGRGSRLTGQAPGAQALCGACGDGKLAISYDGSIYPCVFARHERVGDISRHDLADVLRSDRLQAFRAGMVRRPRMCVPEPCTPDDTGGPYPCAPTDCTPTCTPSDPKCGPDFG